jgi:hypothetical protein
LENAEEALFIARKAESMKEHGWAYRSLDTQYENVGDAASIVRNILEHEEKDELARQIDAEKRAGLSIFELSTMAYGL